MLVTDRHRCRPPGLLSAIAAAVAAGVDAVQVREKDLMADELYDLCLAVRMMTRGKCLMLVNERLDVALAVGADGVHLPERGLPIAALRPVTPAGFLLGRSVHSAEGASTAASAGASYVQLGTIFSTASKPGLQPAGPELVQAAVSTTKVPCLAVGGIDAGNAASVLAAGASGIAVVSAILQAPDIPLAVRLLRDSMRNEPLPRLPSN
jgi:thiamine-phosphate pyrophosphorylase